MRLLVDKLMDEERLNEKERAEVAADPDSRRMLFWDGYERRGRYLLISDRAEDQARCGTRPAWCCGDCHPTS